MQDDLRRLIAHLLISASDADGKIHPREEKIIRLGLGSDVYHQALEVYRTADKEERASIMKEVGTVLQDKQSKEKALLLLKRIFLADGRYDPKEHLWMKEVWDQFQ